MMTKTIKLQRMLFIALIGILGSLVSAVEIAKIAPDDIFFGEEETFLDVDDAFSISSDLLEDEFVIRWKIADKYYLYKQRFAFSATGADLARASIPDGLKKHDEYFGEVEVYYKHVEITIPFKQATSMVNLTIKYQGCADAGLCYTPQTRYLVFKQQPNGMLALSSAVLKKLPAISEENVRNNDVTNMQSTTALTAQVPSIVDTEFVGEAETLSTVLAQGNLFWTLLAFLGAGLLLTFTPCVLPMIPILSGIIAGQGKDLTTAKAFRLSFVYVQAMAITYAVLGVLVAKAGSSLSGYLQSPVIISIVGGIFVLLAFSMFGLFEVKLPAFIQARIHGISENQRGGKYVGVAIMGVISTLIVSPCTSAPLTAALLFIAKSGNAWMGGLSLYFLGLGMGIPLLIIGVSEGRFLPKAGVWMDTVKMLFGFLMLGMALYITSHLYPGPLYLLFWAILLITAAIFFGAFKSASTGAEMLQKSIAINVFLIGVVYFVGAALGNSRLLHPLAGVQTTSSVAIKKHALEFARVDSLAELDKQLQQAKQAKRPVMVDFFADWCVACFELEDFTFSDPAVQQLLKAKNVLLLQADVTANSDLDIELMQHFNIFGLPAILFFDSKGNELVTKRATGFEDAETFTNRLRTVLK